MSLSAKSPGAPGTGGCFSRNPRQLLFFLLLALVIFFPRAAAAEEKARYETRYSTIYCDTPEELLEFGRKLGGASALVSSYNPQALVMIKDNVDKIVFRVKTLLDMYPAELRFVIRIYPTHIEIRQVYRDFGVMGAAPIAFYSHRSRTMYLSLEKLNDRVFAHEVAHAVINNYFSSPPPSQMQEILAQYVDKHLWDN